MSLRAKRFMKSTAVSLALATGSSPPVGLTRSLLRMMGIGYSPPLHPLAYQGDVQCACCISVDFDATVPERLQPNGEGTKLVVELGDSFHIPMTWAICGKTADEDRRSYDRILDASVKHEIGIHTYSHIDASKSTPQDLEAEIERCISSLGLNGRPRTFIYPWNRVAHFETVKKCGFIAYRDKQRVIGFPKKVNGLWNVAPVWYLDGNSLGAKNLIRRVIDLSIASRSVFHLWFHPWSVVDPTPQTFSREVLEPSLSYLREKSDEGRVVLQTVGDLAQWLESRNEVTA
jgi:peptidoglycan/xylan/chitin deacetylase (PgdA/CDA1 family)